MSPLERRSHVMAHQRACGRSVGWGDATCRTRLHCSRRSRIDRLKRPSGRWTAPNAVPKRRIEA